MGVGIRMTKTNDMYCVWQTGEFCLSKNMGEFTKSLNNKSPYMLICSSTKKTIVYKWLGKDKATQFFNEVIF